MNKSIIVMTIKQLLNRPARLIILACFACFPIVLDVMNRQMGRTESLSNSPVISNISVFVMIIAAGIIGQDVSDGILPLIFSRPIKRWRYVLSKWLTVTCLAFCVMLLPLMVHLLYCYGFTSDAINHLAISDLLHGIFLSAGTTAVMLLISSLLPGAADLGVILLVMAIAFLMILLEEAFHVPGMTEAASNINEILFPSIDVSSIQTWRDVSTVEVGRYFTVLTLCLSGSILLVNQKEFSYGSS